MIFSKKKTFFLFFAHSFWISSLSSRENNPYHRLPFIIFHLNSLYKKRKSITSCIAFLPLFFLMTFFFCKDVCGWFFIQDYFDLYFIITCIITCREKFPRFFFFFFCNKMLLVKLWLFWNPFITTDSPYHYFMLFFSQYEPPSLYTVIHNVPNFLLVQTLVF